MSTSPSQPPYHHGDLPAALLAAAERLLREHGPAGLSLREVARQAGVSHNAPYRHFPTREALLAALAAEGFHRLDAVLREAAASAAQTGEAPLLPLGRAYLRFAAAHPALYRLMFGAGPRKDEHPALRAAAAPAFATLAACTPDRQAAIGAWALVHGLAQLLQDGQVAEELVGPELIEAVLGRYLRGVA